MSAYAEDVLALRERVRQLEAAQVALKGSRETWVQEALGAVGRAEAAEARVVELAAALRTVLENLGVPQADTPAPIAHAYEVATALLEGR